MCVYDEMYKKERAINIIDSVNNNSGINQWSIILNIAVMIVV